ncbi:MAG: VCBS repeat-containing protein [Bacteroidota bacterium]
MRKFTTLLLLSFVFNLSAQNTLFTLVSPNQSKVTFNNKLKDTEEHSIMIYSNYYGGAGVGLGDVNNDGLIDLYFAGNLVGDQLYLNKGNLGFEEVTKQAGIEDNGGWSSGVLMADVNQDGWLDIYVTRELYDDQADLRANLLYINNGDGKFTESAAAYGVADTARTRHATFLDYDRDGDLDLFLLNQPPNPGDYSEFYNAPLITEEYHPKLYEYTGEKFIDVTEKAGLNNTGFPNSVTASDLNGDGWTDLYVANDFWIGDWYYINNGDGTFSNKIQDYARHTSFSSMGVDAADINNDGRLDIGIVDMAAEDNYRQKANMSGMNPAAFWKVVEDGEGYQYMFNTLQLNVGEGQLSDIAQLAGVATTDWSWSILMADLDNDGWKDMYITNGLMRDIRNKDAAKQFKEYVESNLYKYIQTHPDQLENINVWDVVDLQETLALVPSEKLKNYAYRNNGDLTFSKQSEDWGFSQETFSNGAAYADLDQDGDLDLVVNNINDVAMIYENHASEKQDGNYLRIEPIADQKGVTAHGTKVWLKSDEGEQFFEITGVRGMYSTSEMVAHFGLGKLKKVNEVRVQWADGKTQILKNVKANQQLPVKYSKARKVYEKKKAPAPTLFSKTEENFLNHRHQENIFDDYKPQVLLPHKMSAFGPSLAVSDVNGDGLEDVFVGSAVMEVASLYLQDQAGNFTASNLELWQKDKRHEDLDAAFFDADNDGDLDLYVVSGGNEFLKDSPSYQDRLYLNDGNGNFSKRNDLLPEIRISGSKVRPMDFDQDGDLDLFVGGRHTPWKYPEPTSSLLLKNEGGKFIDATAELAPDLKSIGMVNDAAWMDSDQDGWQDLVLIGEWMPLTILQNQKGIFKRANASNYLDQDSNGWWFGLEVADVDQDGDQDIIAGNLGLNYKYKASKKEPFEVYYYDFDDNNSKDIVLTYYNFGIQYPLRGRQCSSEQIPALKKKFETYDLFASADASAIYGDNKLENALHYEATTFASTYFENKGDGTFEAHELPMLAQLSSINDFIVEDFNADGSLDLLFAGNLYHAEVETARNDAAYGLLLLGDGKGNFEPLDQLKSGFYVPYDVKNLRKIERLGKQYILVGCNDEEVQIFEIKK